MENKSNWLYLSIVDTNSPVEKRFVGGYYVQQDNPETSTLDRQSWTVSLPNGLEILIIDTKDTNIPPDHKYHDRLLSLKELRKAGVGKLNR